MNVALEKPISEKITLIAIKPMVTGIAEKSILYLSSKLSKIVSLIQAKVMWVHFKLSLLVKTAARAAAVVGVFTTTVRKIVFEP